MTCAGNKFLFHSKNIFLIISVIFLIPLAIIYVFLGHLDSVLIVNDIIANVWLDGVFIWITKMDDTLIYGVVALRLLLRRNFRNFWIAGISMLCMGILVNVGKRILFSAYKRPIAYMNERGN